MSIAEEIIKSGNVGHCPVSQVREFMASDSNGLEFCKEPQRFLKLWEGLNEKRSTNLLFKNIGMYSRWLS